MRAFDMDKFKLTKIIENSGNGYEEYHFEVTNEADTDIYLSCVEMFLCYDLCVKGLSSGKYSVFRSGRHKNDMPGVFVTGEVDDRLFDVSSGMTESGDKETVDDALSGGYLISSDHLTLIKDHKGKTLAIEFLTGRDQLFETRIKLDSNANIEYIKSDVIFNIYISPGETVNTESMRIALVDDTQKEIESFASRKTALYGSRNTRRPAVFCTWYFYELNVTYEDVKTNLEIMKKRHLPYDVFQVDEGWERTLGEYEPNEKFPITMEKLASEIREAGFVPGLWSSPFVAHESATIWTKHPEWILKDKNGQPCLFPMNDTVYYVFDITDEGTWAYFKDLYHIFTFEWGYSYHKLDFTRAAVIYEDADFFNKKITLAKAYYMAVKAIREGMGEDAFFLMCGGLYDPIIGLVDAQRTGSDVLSMWSSNINKNGKTAPYTIRQSVMRYYMNLWWANDPDALMVRKSDVMQRGSRLTLGLLNDDEVKTSVMNQFTGGGIMCQTEPLDQISDERLFEIRHVLPVLNTKATPLDVMSSERFPGAIKVNIPGIDATYICTTNWSESERKKLILDMSVLTKDKNAKYVVCGFYSGIYKSGIGACDIVNMGDINPHASEIIKVQKMSDKPIIVASDNNYTMGGECLNLAVKNEELIIEVRNLLPVDLIYKVLLPEGFVYGGRDLVDVFIPWKSPDIRTISCRVKLEKR
jgi:hypothetical protein